MTMRPFNFLKPLFFRTATYYVLVALLIMVSVNVEKAKFIRVNYLKDYARYPAKYLRHEVEYDQEKFRLAKKHYEALSVSLTYIKDNSFIRVPASLSRSYTMIGICDYYLGHTGDALKYFHKALQIEPRHFWLKYNLGLVYFQRGEYSAALKYLEDSYRLDTKDLAESMELDYFQHWPPHLASAYEAVSILTFHDTITNSMALAILAYERMKKPELIKPLAVLGLKFGFEEQKDFFRYYAGLTDRKPDDKKIDMIYNPSLNFVPIGQEKFFVKKYREH